MSDSTFTSNSVNGAGSGGGIFNESGGTLTVGNSNLTDNSATYYGGGLTTMVR